MGTQLVLDKFDLRQECQRRKDKAAALRAVANYVLRHSSIFARDGARLWTPEQTTQQQQQRIEAVAAKTNGLADPTFQGAVTYEQFESLLGEHKLGFFPETGLVSAVARTFV